ncbi:MAG: hypothetical protein IPK82_13725 [Polyangiaceae bacterium]|nr:hypothetical protein [Polyangiaceae bacterium]
MSSSPKRPSPPAPDPNWEMELHGPPAKRKTTGDSRDEMLAHAVLRIEQDPFDLTDEFGDTDRVTLPPPTGMDDHVAKMMAEAALLEDVENEGDRPTPLIEVEAAVFTRPVRQSEPTPRAPIPATSSTRAASPGPVRTQPTQMRTQSEAVRTQPAPQPSRIVPRSITPVPFAAARPSATNPQASGVTRSPVRAPTPAPFAAPRPAPRTPPPVAPARSPVRASTPAPFAAPQPAPRTPPPAAPVIARPAVRAPTPAPFPAPRAAPKNAPAAPHAAVRATAALPPEGARDRIPSSLDFDDLPAVFAFGDLDEPASVPPRSAPISDPAISPSLMSPPISEPAISPPFGSVDSKRFGAAVGGVAARSATPAPVPRSTPPTASDAVSVLIAGIEARFSAKDYGRALVMAEAALEEHPNNPSVVAYTKRCREELCTRYLERLGADDHVPRLAMHRGALTGLSLDHRAGFLLSCVDGMSTVDEIVDVSAMPKLDAVRLLYELVQEGVLEMVPRR